MTASTRVLLLSRYLDTKAARLPLQNFAGLAADVLLLCAALRADFLCIGSLADGGHARNVLRNLAQLLALFGPGSGVRRLSGVVRVFCGNAPLRLLKRRKCWQFSDGRNRQNQLRQADALTLSSPLRLRQPAQRKIQTVTALCQRRNSSQVGPKFDPCLFVGLLRIDSL